MAKLNSVPVSLVEIPSIAEAGQELPCLCGCGRLTQSRFFPGCDGTLTRAVRALEHGVSFPKGHYILTSAKIEAAHRAAAGVTKRSHQKLFIQRSDFE